MANEIEIRHALRGLHAVSLHPRGIWTGLHRQFDTKMVDGWTSNPGISRVVKSSEKGAATTASAAVAKQLEGKGRLYLEDCHIELSAKDDVGPADAGYAKYAFDKEKEERLWDDSLKMTGF